MDGNGTLLPKAGYAIAHTGGMQPFANMRRDELMHAGKIHVALRHFLAYHGISNSKPLKSSLLSASFLKHSMRFALPGCPKNRQLSQVYHGLLPAALSSISKSNASLPGLAMLTTLLRLFARHDAHTHHGE
jgi:hypothetical protein